MLIGDLTRRLPDWRDAGLAWATTAGYRRRLAEATEIIRRHPDHAVSISWGKDSVALLHLAASEIGAVRACWGRYGDTERLPDEEDVRDALLSRPECADIELNVVDLGGEWAMFERAGEMFLDADTPERRAAVRSYQSEFQEGLESLRAPSTGWFWGLRASESDGRSVHVATRGLEYERRGVPICLPLARWRHEDVWAYHAVHDLPYLAIYDHGDRNTVRGEMTFGAGRGSLLADRGCWRLWESAYPGILDPWRERWPDAFAA